MRNIGITLLIILLSFYLVQFLEDLRPPYFNEIDDITLERLNPDEDFQFSYLTLITGLRDNSDEFVTTKVVFDGVDYREVGEYIVTLRATDIWGNVFDRDVHVSVVDTRAPYFSVPDLDIRLGEFDRIDWGFFLYAVFNSSRMEHSILLCLFAFLKLFPKPASLSFLSGIKLSFISQEPKFG